MLLLIPKLLPLGVVPERATCRWSRSFVAMRGIVAKVVQKEGNRYHHEAHSVSDELGGDHLDYAPGDPTARNGVRFDPIDEVDDPRSEYEEPRGDASDDTKDAD